MDPKCTNPRQYGANESLCKFPLSVLTFNVYPGLILPHTDLFPHRIAAQVTALRALQPDIVCLQELFCAKSFTVLKNAFSDYDVRWDEAAEEPPDNQHPRRRHRCRPIDPLLIGAIIETLLFIAVWCSSWRPLLLVPLLTLSVIGAAMLLLLLSRNSGLWALLTNRRTGLAIMVRRERASVAAHLVKRFATQGGDPLNLVAPRGFSRTTLSVKSECQCGPGVVYVFNTHLNALGPSSYRTAQAHQLASEIKEVSKCARIIVCGDFNEQPLLSSGVRGCLEGSGECDAYLMNADPLQLPTYCPALNPLAHGTKNECLDHIYFKPGSKEGLIPTESSKLVFTETAPCLSDHYGLIAHFH